MITTTTELLEFAPSETCRCMQCDGVIPNEHIVARLVTARFDGIRMQPTHAHIRAWCEHCSAMYELRRQLRGGVWQLMSGVELVIDTKRRERLLALINHFRKVRQQQSVALAAI